MDILDISTKPNKNIVFTILLTTMWAKFHLPRSIVTEISLFGYVVYSLADVFLVNIIIYLKLQWTSLFAKIAHPVLFDGLQVFLQHIFGHDNSFLAESHTPSQIHIYSKPMKEWKKGN